MKKKVCYIGFFPDYEALFFRNSSSELIDVNCYNPMLETNNIYGFKYLPRFVRNWIHKFKIKDYIYKNKDQYYIFNEHRLLLQAVCELLKLNNNAYFRGTLLLRNPVADNYKIKPNLEILKNNAVSIWTFDYGDHQKFGYKLYRQFVSILPEFLQNSITTDFSFVGRDKGRKNLLDNLENKFKTIGYRVDFNILMVQDRNLSYIEYLERSLQAYCMVEILQKGQRGMTLRAIEALLYKRKLITNNQDILQADFYHPDNILLLDEVELLSEDKIKLFMEKPYYPISHSITQKYTTKFLLDTVVN